MKKFFIDVSNTIKYDIIVAPRYTGKWFSFKEGMLRRKSIILYKMWLNIIVKNSYFSLKPTTKIEKISLRKIVYLKEITFYGWRNWYSNIMFEPALPKHMQQMRQYVEILNIINNLIKEGAK